MCKLMLVTAIDGVHVPSAKWANVDSKNNQNASHYALT